jgi:hypothetical protein
MDAYGGEYVYKWNVAAGAWGPPIWFAKKVFPTGTYYGEYDSATLLYKPWVWKPLQAGGRKQRRSSRQTQRKQRNQRKQVNQRRSTQRR